MFLEILFGILSLILVLLISGIGFVYWLFSKIFASIQPLPPLGNVTEDCEESERNPLFRHLPNLRSKLGWNELGKFPTPIHKVQLRRGNHTLQFWMKREDLSSNIYGGNKVRTLQYQVASCLAHLEKNRSAKFYVIGSGGSNQVVATLAHGNSVGLQFHVSYPNPDAPDIDNTLNLLSTFSLGPLSYALWDSVLPQMMMLVRAVTSKSDKVVGPGGLSIGGILGQMGGALELAEQIARKEVPDVDEIYLPMGSSCTTTGLILGVCLSRYLKLDAFKSPHFKIVSVMIHHGFATLNRKTNCFKNSAAKYICFAPRYGVAQVSKFFEKLTGIDLEPSAIAFLESEWELVDEPEYVGTYGTHSDKSRVASALDVSFEMSGSCPEWIVNGVPPPPWLCGHFTGKSFSYMLDRLESRADGSKMEILLWQTKSNVQPLGTEDEWTQLQATAQKSKMIKQWVNEGKATSVLRPAKIDLDKGNPTDYRHVMTQIRKQ